MLAYAACLLARWFIAKLLFPAATPLCMLHDASVSFPLYWHIGASPSPVCLYNNGRIHLGHNLSPHTLLTPVCLGETIRGNVVNEMSLAAETVSVPPVTHFGPHTSVCKRRYVISCV